MEKIKSGFPPIAGKSARVLILGSMPGEESLRKKQYYAHPRNSFWHIMSRLLNAGPVADYRARTRLLLENHIALWDVVRFCEREGSLDSSIKNGSVSVNDFAAFYTKYRGIKRIFFNGGAAEREYLKRVLPSLPAGLQGIKYLRLPSTSPAMAGLTTERKLAAWSVIIKEFKRGG